MRLNEYIINPTNEMGSCDMLQVIYQSDSAHVLFSINGETIKVPVVEIIELEKILKEIRRNQ